MTEYDLTPSQIPWAKHENIEKLWIFQIYVKLPEFFLVEESIPHLLNINCDRLAQFWVISQEAQ